LAWLAGCSLPFGQRGNPWRRHCGSFNLSSNANGYRLHYTEEYPPKANPAVWVFFHSIEGDSEDAIQENSNIGRFINVD